MNRVKEQLESSYETSSLSVRSYNLAIGLTLAYGCILSAILASSTKRFCNWYKSLVVCNYLFCS